MRSQNFRSQTFVQEKRWSDPAVKSALHQAEHTDLNLIWYTQIQRQSTAKKLDVSTHTHRNRGWMSSSVMFSAYTMIFENIHIPQVIEHWAIIAGWLSRYNTSAYCYIHHLIQVTLHQNNNRTSLCNTQPSFYGLCWIVINFPELNSSASFIQINTVTEASSFTHNHKKCLTVYQCLPNQKHVHKSTCITFLSANQILVYIYMYFPTVMQAFLSH